MLHDDRSIRIRETQKHVDPVDPDPDPQHRAAHVQNLSIPVNLCKKGT